MVPAVYQTIINHSKIVIFGDRPVFIVQRVEAVVKYTAWLDLNQRHDTLYQLSYQQYSL